MHKIAFTSCLSATIYPQQGIWKRIANEAPGHLLLMGDSIYIDVPYSGVHPRDMSEYEFLQHLYKRYALQLAQLDFADLVKAAQVHAIWDDHDFLWNESYEEQAIKRKIYRGHVRASRAMFNAFNRTLGARLKPGSFPLDDQAPELWKPDEPEPGYRYHDLGDQVALHLTDGRSFRHKRTLLGGAQRLAIETKIAALPAQTTHLLVSGSVVEAHKGDHWTSFEDYAWLQALARRHNILVLSGDIHENRFHAIDVGAGRFLFDATSSGAAVKSLVSLGSKRENFGTLSIDAASIRVQFFAAGTAGTPAPVVIDRHSWLAH